MKNYAFVLCIRVGRMLVALCLASPVALIAQESISAHEQPLPAVSIIIDDLGNRKQTGHRVVALPGAVACAFLPHAPYTHQLALLAHSGNKEVMLHAPMESEKQGNLGPGALTLNMDQDQFIATLQKDIAAVPHVRGINNHMGSLLTRHPGHMLWLMQEINRQGGLFFVDSRTTTRTVASKIAGEIGVPSLQRDVFLDNVREPEAIERQFNELIAVAKRKGTALAIGHGYQSTLSVLERLLPQLEAHGVRLVPVSELINLRKQRVDSWRVSLYH